MFLIYIAFIATDTAQRHPGKPYFSPHLPVDSFLTCTVHTVYKKNSVHSIALLVADILFNFIYL